MNTIRKITVGDETVKQVLWDILKGCICSAVVLWLFYRNPLIVLAGSLPYGIWNRKKIKRERDVKEKEKTAQEFREVMIDIASSLAAGHSVENAWKEATENIDTLYGERSLLRKRMQGVCAQLACSRPMEYALMELAEECGVEDMIHFAEVFQTAKRMGGNLIEVSRKTAANISERIEIKREISAMYAGKRLEGRVMSVIPLGIIFYFQVCSTGFMDCLYTASGHVVMTVFLSIYLVALKWSERIGDIAI